MIASPWFNCSKTADISGAVAVAAGAGITPGGGGGGGGGGAPPPETLRVGTGGGGGGGGGTPLAELGVEPVLTCPRASRASMPLGSFQVKPFG